MFPYGVDSMNPKFEFLKINSQLEERRNQGLFRKCPCIESRRGSIISVDGKEYINFSSNDYLGLSMEPEILHAWKQGLEIWGAGSGASPLVTGLSKAHRDLQDEICEWLGVEAVILFNSGFAANQAIVKALNNEHTVIYADKLSHASLQEASVLSGAKYVRFPHNEYQTLSSKIKDQTGIVITEGVFSMDGDEAPIEKIRNISDKSGNIFVLDDAHGFGVHGDEGRGTISKHGLKHSSIDVIMGTFGKAIGTTGAFVAGSSEFISYMINFSREYIYSTHMAPAAAYATHQAIRLVRTRNDLRENLSSNVSYFKNCISQISLTPSNSTTSIQPIIIGNSEKALQWSDCLKSLNCYVSAIRHPTVPKNTARLRVTITASHRREEIDRLVEGLSECRKIL